MTPKALSREIKFRAKTLDGLWFYWSVHAPIDMGTMSSQIDWNTLGQNTGLHDKNGKEIYEGDIITWNNQIYTIKWSDDEALFGFYGFKYEYDINEAFEYISPLWEVGNSAEIIGNIYENPELTIKPFLNNYESTK